VDINDYFTIVMIISLMAILRLSLRGFKLNILKLWR